MKILLGHTYYAHPDDLKRRIDLWLGRLRQAGICIDGFVLTLNAPGPPLPWRELDARWRRGDRQLFSMYEDLAVRLESYDVFVNYNGINLHPEFVRQLRIFKVYSCFDDPESSEWLSRPVAAAYDLAMVGNIAEVERYKSWGVRDALWWPNGFHPGDFNPNLTKEGILEGRRDTDIAILCERASPWRASRLDRFAAAFPDGAYYGRGWKRGFLPEERRVPLLESTKIGPNFHNSTGPVNSRTYVIPANGVLQICDNKEWLGKIYDVGVEAVGFDTVEEAIDLTRYYLSHDEERRQIAAAGWERVHRDYNEIAIFQRFLRELEKRIQSPPSARESPVTSIGDLRRRRVLSVIRHTAFRPVRFFRRLLALASNHVA